MARKTYQTPCCFCPEAGAAGGRGAGAPVAMQVVMFFFCKSKNSNHASFILPKPCFIDHLALSLLYMLTAIFFGTM